MKGLKLLTLKGAQRMQKLRMKEKDGRKRSQGLHPIYYTTLNNTSSLLLKFPNSDASTFNKATELLIQIATHGENSGFEVLCLIISATDDLDPYPLAIQDSTRASPLLLNGRIIHVEGMRPNSGALRGGNLEEETCFEFRVLAQNYTETPGHPSSNFWNHDSGRLQGYMLSSPPSHSVFVVSKFKLTRDLFSGGDSSQWIH